MKTTGRAQAERGKRVERALAATLSPWGFRRVPCSGAAARTHDASDPAFGDIRRDLDRGPFPIRVIESKKRLGALKQPRQWLGNADALIVTTGPVNREEPLVIMTLSKFVAILEAAEPKR